MKKTDCTQAEYRSEAPAVKIDGSVEGFIPVDYSCQIFCDGKPVTEDEYSGNDTCTYEIKILPKVTYSTSVLPETSHPFDKRVDIQAYRVEKAENIKITLDEQSENVLVIDAFGHGSYMPAITDGKNDYVQTLSGNSAIFLATDGDGVGYGYKAKSIVDAKPASPVTPSPDPSKTPKPGTTTVPAKGAKYTVGTLTYKVTKSSATAGTVTVIGAKTEKAASVTIPKTVKISGYTFKVTAVNAKAFSGYSKLTKAVIGANVASIGKQAFKGCSKLKNITFKTTKLTTGKVGANAFKGIEAAAKIKVPKSRLARYKKILKAKGVDSKAKIKAS